jgi:hypothetical protein
MADDQKMTVDELNSLLVGPKQQAIEAGKKAPAPTQAVAPQGDFSVEDLNRLTASTPAPKVGFGEDILRAGGSGLARGAVGLTGLPGDIESLGRMGAKAVGYDVAPETVLPTSEEMIQKAQKYIPGAKEFMEYKPEWAPSRYAKTAAEFLPGALAGPGGFASKVAGSVGAGIATQGIEDYMHGTKWEGTPYEAAAKIVASIPGYGLGTKALDIARAPVSGLITPEAEAMRRLAGAMQKDVTVGGKYGARLTPEEIAAAGGESTIGAVGGQRTQDVIRGAATRAPEEAQGAYIARTGRMAEEAPQEMGSFINRMFGGNPVNPLDEMERIARESRIVNGPEYQRVMGLQHAQQIISRDLENVVSRLPKGAINEIADRLRMDGIDPASLGMMLNRGQWSINPNGMPLQFWDATKRYLDTNIAKLRDPVSGKITDKGLDKSWNETNKILKSSLDTAVPEYGAVRGAAAESFGATSAMDLGMKYLHEKDPAKIRNIERIYQNLSPSHQQEFAYGLAGAYKTGFEQNPDQAFKLLSGGRGTEYQRKLQFGLAPIGSDAAESLINFSKIQAANRTINQIRPQSDTFMRSNLIPGLTGAGAFVSDVLFQPFLWSGNPGAFATATAGFLGGKYYTWKEARNGAKVMELASDPSKLNELRRLIKADPSANSFLGKTQALIQNYSKYPAGAYTSTEMQGQAKGGRIGRKAGGRISAESHAADLMRRAEIAKKNIGKHTEALLNKPDETVVKALQIANQTLEG